jgi:hypothetical protein
MNQPARKTKDQDFPGRENSSITHAVVMSVEDRRLDYILEWPLPADGKKGAVRFASKPGESRTSPLASDNYFGSLFSAPSHYNRGVHAELQKGLMRTILRVDNHGVISKDCLGEYGIRAYSALPLKQSVPAQYVASTLWPTFPNRVILSPAQSERNS